MNFFEANCQKLRLSPVLMSMNHCPGTNIIHVQAHVCLKDYFFRLEEVPYNDFLLQQLFATTKYLAALLQ
jgi:hypothetical protein